MNNPEPSQVSCLVHIIVVHHNQGFIFVWLKPDKLFAQMPLPRKRHTDTSQARLTHWVPPGTLASLLGGISMPA